MFTPFLCSVRMQLDTGVRVTTETRQIDRLGQLSEFEQDSNTDSEQESNADSHSARNKAQATQQSMAEPGEMAPQTGVRSSSPPIPLA